MWRTVDSIDTRLTQEINVTVTSVLKSMVFYVLVQQITWN